MSDNRIENPYFFKKNELSIIKRNFIDYNDWTKSCFDEIKREIVGYLRSEQNNKCCYCKRQLGFDLKEVDIEHIFPKSKHSSFTFEPKNLSLSCPGCNTNKGSLNVTNYDYKRYPIKSGKIYIVHAHMDNYYDHINIINDLIYVPKSEKGCKTIEFCKLFRIEQVENRAIQVSNKTHIAKLVETLRNAKNDEKSQIKQVLMDILHS